MLILSRKKGEAIVIYDEKTGELVAEISVFEAKINGAEEVVVKLGVDATRKYTILRRELSKLVDP